MSERNADKIFIAQNQGRHMSLGFPHLSSNTRMCMCLDWCCQGKGGCICKACLCRMGVKKHGDRK